MGMFTILSVEAVTEVSKVLTFYIFNNTKKLTGFLQIQMYDLEKDEITRRFRNLSSILVREFSLWVCGCKFCVSKLLLY